MVIVFSLIKLIDDIRSKVFIKGINIALNFLLLFIIIGSATFNNDWIAYEELYDGIKPTYDLLYISGFNLFKFLGLDYLNFYRWNQILIFSLILYFVTRFTNKYIFIVVFTILVITCPNLSILLRYYTAFAFFLIAIYHFRVNRNSFLGYIFLFLAIISHFGAIILLTAFLVFRFIKVDTAFLFVIVFGFFLLVFNEFLFELLRAFNIGSFELYISEEETSSFRGGILSLLPYIPWIYSVNRRNRLNLSKLSSLINNREYIFLYQISVFPFFFIFLSIYTQIIQHRYIEPFAIIWCVFLCYSIKFEISKIKVFFRIGNIFLLILLSLYLKYFLPLLLIGRSEWLIHYIQILNSNSFNIFNFSEL